jgi:xylose isomerase
MTDFFKDIPAIRFEGPCTDNEFAFRNYDPDALNRGKPMRD